MGDCVDSFKFKNVFVSPVWLRARELWGIAGHRGASRGRRVRSQDFTMDRRVSGQPRVVICGELKNTITLAKMGPRKVTWFVNSWSRGDAHMMEHITDGFFHKKHDTYSDLEDKL